MEGVVFPSLLKHRLYAVDFFLEFAHISCLLMNFILSVVLSAVLAEFVKTFACKFL